MSPRCAVRGSINIDEFFHVNSIVRPGQTLSSGKLETRAGGKGANQAVAIARAGGAVDLVGAVGTDGAWVTSQLQSFGVNTSRITVAEESTGRAIIQLTPEGENSIILYKGANYSTRIPSSDVQFPEGTTFLLIQNEIPWDSSLAYLDATHATKVASVWNPSPMPSAEQIRSFPWAKLDWLVINEGESHDLHRILFPHTSIPSFDPANPYQTILPVISALAGKFGSTNIVCTLGASGVLALMRQEDSAFAEPIALPAARLLGEIRDTTGAGDCFTGYMVAGLMDLPVPYTRDDVQYVLRRCVQAAGMCVENYGALESIPDKSDVDIRHQSQF